MVHGDPHTNNILLKLPDLTSCTGGDIYKRFGDPQKLPVGRLDKLPKGPGTPAYCVPPAMIYVSSEDVLEEATIIISDFGESFFTAEAPLNLHTPIILLPPELFFKEQLGKPADVWTLGCTLYGILGKRALFEGFNPDKDDIIAEMISTLGCLPERWAEKWQHKSDFFLEDGSWKQDTHRIHSPFSRPLKERLRVMGRGRDPESCELSME